ncbi:TetR/AcrR family transcriptional regulator [Clostridium sp. MB40-C1]|uniref:TetR/AcrR family transcriptional regulator n=1 Tax=Clostridium sp. MB40-C1 TaxID=3070996 RepID=UPI0027E19C67|nr:TetR/AcrR family transcriptional regulator [Clostridium sp. MB40-C1]WMJ79488.1 TetR/AcrR family transcriptional regulator [Clostridium sp. MB40-C1]
MARNKYPEETVNRILEVSLKLFMEKGYEHTSIQNIIDELGGLTKGAIYHHFKSKEDILLAVAEDIYKETDIRLSAIRDDKRLNGLQRLQKMFHSSLESPSQYEMFSVAPNLLKNPQILAIQLQGIIDETVPFYILPVIEQGIADGSIQTDYPKELSEVLMLLTNMWLNPMIFAVSSTEMLNKCRFFQKILLSLGLDLIDDRMLELFDQYTKLYEEKKNK